MFWIFFLFPFFSGGGQFWGFSLANLEVRLPKVKFFLKIKNPKNTRNTDDSLCSGAKLLLPSWLLGFSTQGERDTISTMLTVQSDPTTRGHTIVPNWIGLTQVQKSTRFVQLQISINCCFFKNHPKSSTHHFRARRHSHSQSHFLTEVFIMTSVIVTSLLHEREHLRSMCAPTRALSWTVLSLTKPKDKI